jgi:PQQ-dependent dehydrogenase (s-GDH family)
MRRFAARVFCFALLTFVVGGAVWNAGHAAEAGRETFVSRVLATGLNYPWEITWGPDGYLWITERGAKRVIRVQPSDGSQSTVATINDAVSFDSGQDGVLGMALHPGLLKGTGNNYVYLVSTYDADPSPNARDRRARIQRYTYDPQSHTMGSPVDLITNLPASNDHNSGRLAFGPDQKLYYTIGDQGHNQFDNCCLPIRAQDLPTAAEVAARDWSTYQGKVLRLNLDGSIPADNPTLRGVKSHIFSYGHRNAQGLVFGPGGRLYACEHGPKTDDEVNLIQAGKNYGWPNIAGYKDDRAYVYANWSASQGVPCRSLTYSDFVIPPSVPQQKESAWSHPDFMPPLKTFGTVDNGYNFQDPACAERDLWYICWPTVAPSSIDSYTASRNGIPGWANSLLVTSLKRGVVFRLKLSSDGKSSPGEPIPYFKTTNRYRDIAIGPDQKTFYVITDTAGDTSGPTRGHTSKLDNPGAIIEYRYTGSASTAR